MFTGVVIGDGFTNKYDHHYLVQITGDKKLDENYYSAILQPLCKTIFDVPAKITTTKDALRLSIYSKALFEMLTIRFDIPAGKKCYTIMIPEEIMSAENKFISATLRGMFNTDGGIGFDKRKCYKKPYIRVNYTSAAL